MTCRRPRLLDVGFDLHRGAERRDTLPTIAGVATGNPNFTTLVSALSKAGLVSTFSGARSFTVFAPTNRRLTRAAALLGPGRTGQDLVNGLDVAR